MIGIRYEILQHYTFHGKPKDFSMGFFHGMEGLFSTHEEAQIHSSFKDLKLPPTDVFKTSATRSFFTQQGELKYRKALDLVDYICAKHNAKLVRVVWPSIEDEEILYRDDEQILIQID